jgi:CheY-like chemotaxis protein
MVLNSGCMSPSRTVESRPAKPRKCRGVHHREIQLLVGGAEAVEQIEGLVEHPARTRLVAIDLVDDDDRTQAVLERLLRDETGLRHGPVHRVHQQQHAVDHGEHALDLAAEVRVPRRVDDVDAIVAPGDGGVLGENGDATLALEHVRIHDALLQVLARIERAGLAQQLIHERGLAMIDVRDDGDVAKFLRHNEVPGKPTIIA